RIDRGFQVYLSAYAECARALDLPGLRLAAFEPGALVRREGDWRTVADPLRRPGLLWSTLKSGIGNWGDRWRVLRLKRELKRASVAEIFERPDISALQTLRERGFSEGMIEGFFRPFFSGIFLENELETSRRVFEFVFKMFGRGYATLPANGIGAIPMQMAHSLDAGRLLLGVPAERVEGRLVHAADGRVFKARAVVLATDAAAVPRLLPEDAPEGAIEFNSTTALYYEAPYSPLPRPTIALNGEQRGLVNNVTVPSDIQPGYAPPGRHLVSVSLLGTHDPDGIRTEVEQQLQDWFGETVRDWQCLTAQVAPDALPRFVGGTCAPRENRARRAERCFRCGDYLHTPSLEGAMIAGRRAAEACIRELGA
ncbi:MAG: FAD-dependent oxidoreductase, partial [Verrucomicrobiota bacterium]